MYFYEILQSIMDEKGLNVPEVARLSGLTDSTVRSMISRKNKTVALEVAFKLAKGLNVTVEELNGEGPAFKDISPSKRKLLRTIDSLDETQLQAVSAFIKYLTENH